MPREAGLKTEDSTDSPPSGPAFEMWTVYDHPTDYPDHFVARCWEIWGGGRDIVATGRYLKADSLDAIRFTLEAWGLTPMMRGEADDPLIVETWI